MKLLVAITTTRPKLTGDKSLRWAGRLGYDLILVGTKGKRKKLLETVADANYHYYLALPDSTVVTRTSALSYAIEHDYDLLLELPDDLDSWRKGMAFKVAEIKIAYETISTARGQFSKKPGMKIKRFTNGAVMRRLK